MVCGGVSGPGAMRRCNRCTTGRHRAVMSSCREGVLGVDGDEESRVEFGFCGTLSLVIWVCTCIVGAAPSRCCGSRSTAFDYHNRLPSCDFGSQRASVRGCSAVTPDFESSVTSCPGPESDFGATDSTPVSDGFVSLYCTAIFGTSLLRGKVPVVHLFHRESSREGGVRCHRVHRTGCELSRERQR